MTNKAILSIVSSWNIMCQSEEFEEADGCIKALENDNISNKARVEALESWVLEQNDEILEVKKRFIEIESDEMITKEPEEINTDTD